MRLTEEFENCAGIYVIKNIKNGKVYVGESLDIKTRMYKHCRSFDQVIHKAINKYGIDNFEVYVEYLKDFNKVDLIELEEQLIIMYDSISPKGYNICAKGSDCSGVIQSMETRKKRSKSLTGIKRTKSEIRKSSISRTGLKRTPQQIKNISEAHKGLIYGPCSEEKKKKISRILKEKYKTEKHPMTGIKQSKEFKEKLSLLKKGVSNVSAMRPIIQMDVNGNFIKEWPSTSIAVLELFKDKSKASSISAALNGRYKTAQGFKWCFKD